MKVNTNDRMSVKIENERANQSKHLGIKNNDQDAGKDVASVSSTNSDIYTPSAELRNITQILNQLKKSSDVRMDKVNELKNLINSGKYSVDSKKISEKIVNLAINKIF